MCGGTIEYEPGATVGVCDSCGTQQTLPRLDNDRKINLYDRANHFRRNNEYDKAAEIYNRILNEEGSDAEAYWSLVLCRYGIEYVEDPVFRKRIPTINRSQFTSIFSDEDYKAALQYADGYQREIYEAEARIIDNIQKSILEISRKEEPFDVFICYKETDNYGRRTQDSVLANDLYYQLVQEGFKVFFSRITLEDKLGAAYEPYIFAALNSSKVMVVLGTKPEYFNSVWVRNEWSRYLALIKNGAPKVLIPAFRDMDPYDLPEEFSHLQAQDMSKLGFMQDLLRGIKKIAGAPVEHNAPAESVPANNEAASNVQALLDRGYMALEDEEWESAGRFFDEVLNFDAKNSMAHLGCALTEMQLPSIEMLKKWRLSYLHHAMPQMISAQEVDSEAFYRIRDYCCRYGIMTETAISERLAFDLQYSSFAGVYNQILENEKEFWQSNKSLVRADRYAVNGDYLKTIKSEVFGEIESCREAELKKNRTQAETIRKNYAAFLQNEEAACKAEFDAQLEEKYFNAVDAKQKAKSLSTCKKAKKLFCEIPDYKDAAENISELSSIIASKKKRIALIAGAAAALLIIAYGSVFHLVPRIRYEDACSKLENGNYDEAYTIFVDLGEDYRDCKEKARQSIYEKACRLIESEEFDKAAAEFDRIPDYSDSAEKANYCRNEYTYRNAMALVNAESYLEAAEIFDGLGEYSDSADQANEARYQMAQKLAKEGDNLGASAIYEQILSYKDSASRKQKLDFASAKKYLKDKKYQEAIDLLEPLAAANYYNASEILTNSRYEFASVSMEAEDYETAMVQYSALGEWEDSPKQYTEAKYLRSVQLIENGDFNTAIIYLTELEKYKKSKNYLAQAYYGKGMALVEKGEYVKAVSCFENAGSYSDTKKQMRNAMYQYAMAHLDKNDSTTYEYLKALRKVGYEDSKKHYLELFAWKAELIAINTSDDDQSTIRSSVSKYERNLHMWFRFSGGPPTGTGSFSFAKIYPDGDVVYGSFYIRDIYPGNTYCIYWKDSIYSNPEKGENGNFTLQLYDIATGDFVGSGSVYITD